MARKYNRIQQGEKAIMDNKQTIIYYNPKCSKCRLTLDLLNDHGTQPKIIEYLDNTPSKLELKEIIAQLGISADQLLRKNESAYQKSGLHDSSAEDEILDALVKYPILMERPIVIHNNKAKIGRPPELVLELF